MLRRILFILILVVPAVYSARAQKPAQYMKLGEEAMAARKYEEAFAYYKAAYELDSSSFDALTAYAESARLVKAYPLAERLYARVYAKDNGKLFPDGLFWLAAMQKLNGHYDDALANFRKYAKKNKKKGYGEKAKREEESCLWAISYKDTPDTMSFGLLGGDVNTGESENAAWIYRGQFYYTGYRNNGWLLMRGNWRDSLADELVALESVQHGRNRANMAFGDGHIFFTDVEPTQESRIWSVNENGRGSEAALLRGISDEGAINTMAHVAVIQGMTYLFFVSDRDGGEGGLDIWISRKENESWGEPFNAGKQINSPDDEVSPFYAAGVLYFSSTWHNGFGGFDVFRCTGSPGMWSSPENMGQPLNSSANDLFYSVFPEQRVCFVSSNRSGSKADPLFANCCNDIYTGRFDVQQTEDERVFQTLAELNDFLPVTLYFHNDEPNPDSWDTTTTFQYSDAYTSYKNLFNTYMKENTRGLEEEARDEAAYEVQDFFNLKVDKGFNDLHLFADLLLEELKQGRHIQLSIRGFASPRAQSDYNKNLTQRRIASLVNEMRILRYGAFIPYIEGTASNGGRLTFVALPFGENKADTAVSDDLNNQKQSIYSRGARLERKIEIESVELAAPVEQKPVLRLPEESFDFGKISHRGGIVHHDFILYNDGTAPMVIDSVIASCGCTEPRIDKTTILPGDKATLDVGFDPFGKKGAEEKYITIYIRGEEPRVLRFRAFVD